jgi:hypothetical protein
MKIFREYSGTQVKESDRIQPADKIRSNSRLWTDIRIPSVGIRWDPSVRIRRNLSVGFDRPLLLIRTQVEKSDVRSCSMI